LAKEKIRSLLVHDRDDRFLILRSALQGLDIETTRVRNCQSAGLVLCDTPPPHLVFTDVVLPDGNWLDLLDLAAKAREKVNLIVVSPRADINMYIDAMNHGAYDFITETFTVPEIVHVVRSGLDNAFLARKETRSLHPKSAGRPAREDSGRKAESLGAARG
jgi:DNA-binding NtrC family response regulator